MLSDCTCLHKYAFLCVYKTKQNICNVIKVTQRALINALDPRLSLTPFPKSVKKKKDKKLPLCFYPNSRTQ